MAALTFNSNKDIHFCQNAFGLTLVLLDSFFFLEASGASSLAGAIIIPGSIEAVCYPPVTGY